LVERDAGKDLKKNGFCATIGRKLAKPTAMRLTKQSQKITKGVEEGVRSEELTRKEKQASLRKGK